MHEGQWFVALLVAGIGAFFVVSGFRGLTGRRLTVVNPRHHSALPEWMLMVDVVFRRMRGAPPRDWSESPRTELRGRDAIGRSLFRLVAGIVCFVVDGIGVWDWLTGAP